MKLNKENIINILCIIIILLSSIMPYLNALVADFVWDDINLIVLDYQIRSWNFLTRIFARDFFGFSDDAKKYGYYRPLITITYALDYRLWKLNPLGYHLSNMIFHFITCLLIFLVLLRTFRGRQLVPLLSTIIFAVHPIHSETITWIAGRTDAICAILFFLSFYLFIVSAERKALRLKINLAIPVQDSTQWDRAYYFGSLCCFILSIMAKEMAVILPIILFLYLIFFITGFRWGGIKKYILNFFLYGMVIVGYGFFRANIVDFSKQATDPFPALVTVLTFVKTIGYYTLKMALPLYQSAYIQNELLETSLRIEFIIPFIFVLLMIYAGIRSISKNIYFSFGIFFWLACLLPLSNFIRISGPKDMGFMTAERFLYIPSLGFCIILGVIFGEMLGYFQKIKPQKISVFPKIVSVFLILAIVLSYAGLTFRRNKVWKNNESFFTNTISRAPTAALLYTILGNIYRLEKKYDKAEQVFQKALEYLAPRDREEPTWVYNDLAGIYAEQGQFEKALETMKLASRTKIHNSAVEYNYGEIYRAMGDYEKAIEYYHRSLRIYRDNLNALTKLGLCYQKMAKWEFANKAFISALNLDPNNAELLNNIGYDYSKLGEPEKAIHYYNNAIDKNPTYSMPYANLGIIYISQGMNKEGMNNLKKALSLDPNNPAAKMTLGIVMYDIKPDLSERLFLEVIKDDPKNVQAYINLALFYEKTKKPDKASAAWKKVLELDPNNDLAQKKLGNSPQG